MTKLHVRAGSATYLRNDTKLDVLAGRGMCRRNENSTYARELEFVKNVKTM